MPLGVKGLIADPSDQPMRSVPALEILPDNGRSAPSFGELVIPLHTEEISISRRTVATSTVRVTTVTQSREQLVEEPLALETVEVERVAIGRIVDAVPEIRQEGDVTIHPVMEEVIVVERRLVLKEEVRIRRVRKTELHTETVQLRQQTAIVTRDGKPVEIGMTQPSS